MSLVSLHGRRLGLANTGNLVGNGIQVSNPAVDAVFTIAAEDTNVRQIAVQLNDANGVPVTQIVPVTLFVFADAAGAALATGGSTGIALGSGGDGILAVTHVAKKVFTFISEPDGDLDLQWTDTGTEAVYLGIQLPNGRIVMSAVVANT